jgi:Shikimate dehydrogenase substrate binding domain
MLEIDGTTRFFGIIADPIAQVKTPQAINRLAAEHGVGAVMIPLHVAADGLAAAFAGLRTMKNFGGMIVRPTQDGGARAVRRRKFARPAGRRHQCGQAGAGRTPRR